MYKPVTLHIPWRNDCNAATRMQDRKLWSCRFVSRFGGTPMGIGARRMLRTVCLLSILVGCGSVKHSSQKDAGMPSDLPLTPGREVISGAGRLTGATYTFDIEIGHSVGQQPTTGVTYRMEGNAAIRP